MKWFDVQHEWFRPIWRRVIVVALCLGWAIFEIIGGSPFWAILFGAMGLYCAHQFLWAFNPPDPDKHDKT
jgi:hypothetical protein